jgi:hypothetical protein
MNEKIMTNNNPHIGSAFDDFLDEENFLVEANEIVIVKSHCLAITTRD